MLLFDNLENDGRVLRTITSLKKKYNITIYSYCDQNNFQINSTKIIKRKSPNYKKNILELIFYTFHVFKIILKNKYDIFYIHDFYLAFPFKLISYFSSSKIVYDSHELLVPDKKDKLNYTNYFFYFLEKISIKNFNLIITANKERSRIMRDHYKLKNMPEVVKNIPNPSIKDGLFKRSVLEKKFKILERNNDIIIIYQGIINQKRGIEKIVMDLSKIRNSKIILIGNGNEKYIKYLKSLFKKKSIKNIYFLGKLDLKTLYSILNISDCGIISYSNINLNNKYCAPNKLYEYALFNLPMITSSQNLFKKTFEKYNIGIIHNETENLENEIYRLINNRNNKIYFEKFNNSHSMESESDKLLKALEKI